MDINSEQGNDSIQANSSTSTAPQEFFSRKMLEISPGIDQVEFVEDPPLLYNYHSQIGGVRLELAGCLVLAWFIVFLALIKGVKSLGKAVYFTAIFPYVILTVLLCFGLSLDGAVAGILYYVTPRLDRLTDVQVEKLSLLQRFFFETVLAPCDVGVGRRGNADLFLIGSLLGLPDHLGQLQ